MVGVGAIGGYIAGALAKSGVDVSVVARGAHLEAIQRDGLRVRSSHLGAFAVRVPASDDLRTLGAFDAVLVTVKAHQWGPMLEQFAPFARSATVIVTMQNGFPFWYYPDRSLETVDPGGRILRSFAYGQIVGAVVHASGNVPEPGVVEHMGGSLYPIGEVSGPPSERVARLSTLFSQAGLDAPVQDDIRRAVWRKLFGNVALNPASALSRASTQAMLRDEGTRALIVAIVEECRTVARAAGCDVAETLDDRIAHMDRLADVKTSMLQDLEARRPLELDPIAGAVVELARDLQVAVPHVDTVYALTRLLERSV